MIPQLRNDVKNLFFCIAATGETCGLDENEICQLALKTLHRALSEDITDLEIRVDVAADFGEFEASYPFFNVKLASFYSPELVISPVNGIVAGPYSPLTWDYPVA